MSLDPVMPPYNASDPTANFLSSSSLDFLLIELVPLAYRVTQECDGGDSSTAAAGEKKSRRRADNNDDDDDDDALPGGNEPADAEQRVSSTGAVTTSAGSATGNGRRFDEEEELDAVHYRLETLGYRVGQGLVERYGRNNMLPISTEPGSSSLRKLCPTRLLGQAVSGPDADTCTTDSRAIGPG